MHASVELSVYSTEHWAAKTRPARPKKPYNFIEMSQSDFYDFKQLACKINKTQH